MNHGTFAQADMLAADNYKWSTLERSASPIWHTLSVRIEMFHVDVRQ